MKHDLWNQELLEQVEVTLEETTEEAELGSQLGQSYDCLKQKTAYGGFLYVRIYE